MLAQLNSGKGPAIRALDLVWAWPASAACALETFNLYGRKVAEIAPALGSIIATAGPLVRIALDL